MDSPLTPNHNSDTLATLWTNSNTIYQYSFQKDTKRNLLLGYCRDTDYRVKLLAKIKKTKNDRVE